MIPKNGKGTSRPVRKIRVLVVDDHPIVRQGLRLTLAQERDMEVCGECETAAAALAAVKAELPNVVIIDLSLKGRGGLDLIKDIRTQTRDLPLLVLSVHDEAIYAERSLRAGARGYVVKHEAARQIVKAIRRVLAGDIFVSDSIATKLLSRFSESRKSDPPETPVSPLSDRELDVLEKFGEGLNARQVAETLGLSVNTVETHRAHIKAKLKIGTAAELVRFAVEWRLSRR